MEEMGRGCFVFHEDPWTLPESIQVRGLSSPGNFGTGLWLLVEDWNPCGILASRVSQYRH